MNISKFLFAAVFITISLFPANSWAQIRSGAFTFSPMIGGIIMDDDQPVDDDMAYSIAVGYNFTEALALEAAGTFAELEVENSNNEVDLENYRLDALYHFMTDRTLVPYVAAGIGSYELDDNSDFMANYGVGLLYFLKDDIALRADVRHLAAFSENNLLYTVGLKFQFGGKGMAEVAPKDSDGDGVLDALDKCPDTLEGIVVDDDGCELKLTLHINFDTDEAVIKPEFKPEIDKAAEFIRKNREVPYIFIAGYTDNAGEPEYNQSLSERRAEAVRQALIDNYDLDPDKLKAKGFGESRPVANNATSEGRYENRRVEIICCAVFPE
ncbi:MAG: hypothetical protein C0615_05710 [Desulfuromonas sp.]|nr:MAG: hypothetical protein C0615_05710 [Desulfuromonas sp.]